MVLPYNSIEEAQEAMGGRDITWLETRWFHSTATVPDEVIFRWSLLVIVIMFHVPTLVLIALDGGLVGANFVARYKIQPSKHLDGPTLRHIYVTVMVLYAGVMVPMILWSYPIFKATGLRMGFPLPTAWEAVSQVVMYYLVHELGNYWLHRWQHTSWMYYKFHFFHHKIKAPGFMVGIYAHPIDMLIGGIPALLGVIIAPPHIITFWIWLVVSILTNFETHSGYDIPTLTGLLTPFWGGAKLHDLHHAYCDHPHGSNFGVSLPLFDILYGTYKDHRYFERVQEAKNLN